MHGIIVRPRVLASLGYSVVTTPMWLGGLWNAIRYNSYLVGIVLIGIPFVIWLYSIGSIRIVATADFIEFRRLFWSEWKLNTAKITISEGRGGDIPILPAVILTDRNSGESHSITRSPFKKKCLDLLLEFLIAHGAESSGGTIHN
jgi:hypothetical protein